MYHNVLIFNMVQQGSLLVSLSHLMIFQDAGPMAHPVRPHSYIKVGNCVLYLVTFSCKDISSP